MALPSFEIYEINDEKHQRLWTEAILVFDSSSLLNMYEYSENVKRDIVEKIFKVSIGRLWIPNHVSYEFQKNCSRVSLNPIDKYTKLKEEFSKIVSLHEEFHKFLKSFKESVRKNDTHPHIEDLLFQTIEDNYTLQATELNNFTGILAEKILQKTAEITNLTDNDIIWSAINDYFEIGDEYTFDEVLDVIDEGKRRYQYEIPPGYMDNKEKIGTQIFGDLIIWKQILDFAEQKNKPILFICDDIKKDWCYKEGKRPYIVSPREELIKEIYDFAGVEFWMYSNPQLLHYADKYLNSNFNQNQIAEVNYISRENQGMELPSCTFTWETHDVVINGSTSYTKTLMNLRGYLGEPIRIDWGDGTGLEYIDSLFIVTHDYALPGVYNVNVYGKISMLCAVGLGKGTARQYPNISHISVDDGQYMNRFQVMDSCIDNVNCNSFQYLTELLLSNNKLEEIDVRMLGGLKLFYCGRNKLTSLDLSNCKLLELFSCDANQISALDFRGLPNIINIHCSHNQLETLELGDHANIAVIRCEGNKISGDMFNKVFEKLPQTKAGKLFISRNPGTDECDKTIAMKKGWIFE